MNKISPKFWKFLLVFNPLISIFIFLFAWWILDNSIDSNRAKYIELNTDLVEKSRNPILFLPQQADTLEYYQLTKSELISLNEHIKYLGNIVTRERDNYSQIIGNDIDRLGMIATLIIGLVALINVIFPVAFNYISTRDLQDKLKKTDKIDDIEEKLILFDQKVIDIDILKLRLSIDKISDFEYLEMQEDDKKELFKNQLIHIKDILKNVFSSGYLEDKTNEIKRHLFILNENLNRIHLSRSRQLLEMNEKLRTELIILIKNQALSEDDLDPIVKAIDKLVKRI